jgi:hypothetical protein
MLLNLHGPWHHPAGRSLRLLPAGLSPRTGSTAAASTASAAATRASATTATAAAGASAATATAATLRAGFVDIERASVQIGAVESCDRLVRLGAIRHFDECKAARTARIPIGHHADAFHIPVRLEKRAHGRFSR